MLENRGWELIQHEDRDHDVVFTTNTHFPNTYNILYTRFLTVSEILSLILKFLR